MKHTCLHKFTVTFEKYQTDSCATLDTGSRGSLHVTTRMSPLSCRVNRETFSRSQWTLDRHSNRSEVVATKTLDQHSRVPGDPRHTQVYLKYSVHRHHQSGKGTYTKRVPAVHLLSHSPCLFFSLSHRASFIRSTEERSN